MICLRDGIGQVRGRSCADIVLSRCLLAGGRASMKAAGRRCTGNPKKCPVPAATAARTSGPHSGRTTPHRSSGVRQWPALAPLPCSHLVGAQRHLQPRAEGRRRDLGCVHGQGHQAGRHAAGGHRVVGRGQREGLEEGVVAVGSSGTGGGREQGALGEVGEAQERP